MKKLFYICIIFSCLFNSYKLTAQLLQPGDAVVSVSPGLFAGLGNCWAVPTTGTNFGTDTVLTLVKICKAPATSIGTCWQMTPSEYSTLTYKHKDWIRNRLGNIFGICIDNLKNIYVTSTGFYGQQYSGISTGSVFKIDASSGNVSLLADLHAADPTNPLSLGNIKFYSGKLFVSDLLSGKIFMLNASTGSILNFYDPGFTDNSKPCGLAIGKTVGSTTKLFFSRNNFNSTTTSIYSINFTGSSFGTSLIQEIPPSDINGVNPITDMAFTKNFDRIIFAERTTNSWNTTNSHNSNIYEFKDNGAGWSNVNPNYYIGSYYTHKNGAGGISFSQSVIGSNCETWKCDTTIVATSDAIFLSLPTCGYTYGITTFRHTNGGGSNAGVNFDINNNINLCSKTFLGDVEICDSTVECFNCKCGEWGDGVPASQGGTGSPMTLAIPASGGGQGGDLFMTCGSSYSFIKGQVAGTLYVNYSCAGSACDKVINWQLVNTATNTPISNGNMNAGPLNMNQFNNLGCGSYKFIFTPKCGNNTCTPCELYINIVCDPPSCCPAQTQVTIQPQSASYNSTGSPNGWGTYSQSFILNSNVPMSEIRIDVEHFELNSKDPDCISCTNKPKTWGSLLGAAYNGNGFVKPITSLPFTSSIYGNGRELIYKTGSLITINNGVVNMNVAMPNASSIDCCVLTANICLKFTFKDANCRECTYLYCNQNIEIKKSEKGQPNGNELKNINKTVQKAIF
jgi:hypothetical protein